MTFHFVGSPVRARRPRAGANLHMMLSVLNCNDAMVLADSGDPLLSESTGAKRSSVSNKPTHADVRAGRVCVRNVILTDFLALLMLGPFWVPALVIGRDVMGTSSPIILSIPP